MTDLTAAAQRALGLMDLTTLNDDDTDEKVIALCRQASSPAGHTAAICIYPRFIPLAETRAAIAYGADEVDVVFPYRAMLAGETRRGFDLVQACKQACIEHQVLLKVIIESGELKQDSHIRQASEIAINAGADFIKTSTGKVPVNATLHSAEVMLNVIKDKGVGNRVGFKAAGGVRTAEEAACYLQLADSIMGEGWADARHFRFGASGLLSSLLNTLGRNTDTSHNDY